ncbi:uncharacterized protein Tco025E_07241 [Trypanosoma conorhini]|uniref:Uncharacterized protein n=1 Tax=Trypanosoma conorhini TaxID=83891 RepID=A0A3R7KL31_9TRYP|nr:uncharacterized protein Tco025E_07241 [Trypanosoma conorhini]RNF09635.1 hypothetical protein Tco025E_07241 [Trypanosoma conorhini]
MTRHHLTPLLPPVSLDSRSSFIHSHRPTQRVRSHIYTMNIKYILFQFPWEFQLHSPSITPKYPASLEKVNGLQRDTHSITIGIDQSRRRDKVIHADTPSEL